MYFLGTLEKILEGTPKVEAAIIVEKKEPTKTVVINHEDKSPEVKKEYKSNSSFTSDKKDNKPYVKKDANTSYNNDSKQKKKPNNCYGVFVKDGDTFDAMYNQERVVFRLAGIDCPEINQPFSEGAKQFLMSKVLRKVVYVEIKGEDAYNRKIVEAYEDKEMKVSINKQLLKEGFATSERYKNNEGELTHNIVEHIGNKITEISANLGDKGMWSDAPATKMEPIKVINEDEPPVLPAESVPFKRKFPK